VNDRNPGQRIAATVARAFMAPRLEGQPLALTRPLDPALTPEAATLVADPSTELLRPSPLTRAAIGTLAAARLSDAPQPRFVRACLEVTGGNPFLVGELLDEAAARGMDPTVAATADVAAIIPRGVANAVLLRLARLTPAAAATLARALSALGDGAQVGDAARLAGLAGADLEAAISGWSPPASWNPAVRSASPTRSCARRYTATCRPPILRRWHCSATPRATR
jgi:hypothetical protein